jgi:hypothetical protein
LIGIVLRAWSVAARIELERPHLTAQVGRGTGVNPCTGERIAPSTRAVDAGRAPVEREHGAHHLRKGDLSGVCESHDQRGVRTGHRHQRSWGAGSHPKQDGDVVSPGIRLADEAMQDAERQLALCARGSERFFDVLKCLFGIFEVENVH